MAVIVGSARSDERGKAAGGRAGDQKKGREVCTQEWYRHKLGWRTFRCKDPAKAKKMAEAMRMLCDTDLLGYDQWQRDTLYDALKAVGWDLCRLDRAVETDCSALIRVCAACADIFLPDFTTGGQAKTLLASGEFVELKGEKYNSQSAFLGAGDVQVTCSKAHTVMVLTDGVKYEGGAMAFPEDDGGLGERILKEGRTGGDVALMQKYLIDLGYDLGRYGADGDFGDCTELAVMEFQRDHGLEADGEYGPLTHAALIAAMEQAKQPDGAQVRIEGGQCWVRETPGGKKLGVAKRSTVWPYMNETDGGWLKIDFGGAEGWVSGTYGKAA